MNRVRPRQFLISLLAAYAVLAVAMGVNYAVLWRAGELRALDDIISRQDRNGAIYNALSIGFADYKYASYRHAAPQIVAIGTSRAMQIRQSFFRKPFYNLGGLTQGPAQANVLADRLLLRGDPPEAVIFVLDFWTFCRPAAAPAAQPRSDQAELVHDGMGQPPRHFLIYRLLLERRFAITDIARLLFLPQNAAEADRIGLGARLGMSGFAADGSIHGTPLKEDALEQRWSEMFARIESGAGQFVKDCSVSEVALDALGVFVDRMEAAGSRVVLLLAPLPGAIIERMAAERQYIYVDQLRSALTARYPYRFDDFLDMRDNAPDSEFLDGIHGGEVVYMRAILAATRRSGSTLREFVDEKYLATQIDLWHGRAQIADDPIRQRFFQ